MGDNSRRRDAYRLPGIKTLTGSPPRPAAAAPPSLPLDVHQHAPGLPPPPPPHYDPQRRYSQQSVPPMPPTPHSSHYPQQPHHHAHPAAGATHHGAPLPRSSTSGHEYGVPPRQEYQPYQQQGHYSHAQPHVHAYAPPGHPQHSYPYADNAAKYGEPASAPAYPRHPSSSGRPGSAYSGSYSQKHAVDSGQASPGTGPMDVSGMVYSQQRHPAMPSPDQAMSSASQSYHPHYRPGPHGSVVSHHPSLLAQHSPLPRQSQQTMHTQSPHYAQQAYSSYASTARESPATNTASYDAYAMPATLSSTPSEANSAVKAVDARLASRSANQKQLAPASVLPSRPAVIASHAPAPPKPPPPLPLVSVSNPALPMSLPLASSALSANVSKSSAAISNLDEDEDDEEEDDDDGGDLDKGEDDALTKRRKRNALSAARLRERRKNREFELTNSCTSLESQIARLQEELDEEKQRAKLDYISKKKPATGSAEGDVAAAVPVDSGSSTVSGLRSGTKRQWTAAQTDGEGDFTMGNAEDGGGAELTGNPKKKSRPLRELDQVRLDDLRAKIETLGQLNQQVCVNLGVLRQEIQRISNAIISQKSDRQALAVA